MGAMGWQQARGIRGEVLVGMLVGVLVLVVVLVELEGQGPGRASCPHHLRATLGIQVARVQVLADQVLLCGRGGEKAFTSVATTTASLGPSDWPSLWFRATPSSSLAESQMSQSQLNQSLRVMVPPHPPGQDPTLTRKGVSG